MRHRGVLVLGLVVLLMPTLSAAQSVTGGAKGGVVFADIPNFSDAMEASTSMRTGLIAGGFLTWSTSGGFGVQPEVLYTHKGVELDEPWVSASIEMSYLDVPVLARYTFSTGATRGYVFGGPSFNFKLDAKVKSNSCQITFAANPMPDAGRGCFYNNKNHGASADIRPCSSLSRLSFL